ncbi:sensor histidine kinase [Flavobacterium sp. Sd200]|uniref:sensor histidine kinase n=1 Tax=Flavobacterium sp. Sd200 TaxID=2692211 RepID=UPI00136BABB0|nr:histidine kinase [Flavobacterium sp. Sd200]MXN93262.1 sensor histidine kinase [Flavobacterium sp. Sd200]
MQEQSIKNYHLKTGCIISVFIALLAFIPRMAQDASPTTATFFVNVLLIFIFSVACWLINQRLVQSGRIPHGITGQLIKITLSFAASLLLSFILIFLFRKHVTTQTFFFFRELKGKRAMLRMVLVRGTFVNAFLYFLSYVFFLSAKNQKSLLENEILKHENLEARLFILKQQLSPHFLFNSLGILNTLTADENVHRYIVQLSNIYRYLLNSNTNHLATLTDEMAFIESYLYILKERFEDALQVNITIAPNHLTKKIPSASLQLLIENAIKHNILLAEEPLQINIFTQDNFIVVSNNFNPKPYNSGSSTGIGLHNINERYKLLSQNSISIQKNNSNFIVKLPLIA